MFEITHFIGNCTLAIFESNNKRDIEIAKSDNQCKIEIAKNLIEGLTIMGAIALQFVNRR